MFPIELATSPLLTAGDNLIFLFKPDFCKYNNSLKSLKLPKTFSSVLIRRSILKRNPNCEVELIDIPRERKQKRNIKRPKLHNVHIGAKEIAQLDMSTDLTTTEINWAQRFIQRIKNVFRKKDNYER